MITPREPIKALLNGSTAMAAPHSLRTRLPCWKSALSDASPDLMRHLLLSTAINALLSARADAVFGAEYGQTSDEQVEFRNGYRHKDPDIGPAPLTWPPKLRQGSYFPEWLLDRRKRAAAAMISGRDLPATCSGSPRGR